MEELFSIAKPYFIDAGKLELFEKFEKLYTCQRDFVIEESRLGKYISQKKFTKKDFTYLVKTCQNIVAQANGNQKKIQNLLREALIKDLKPCYQSIEHGLVGYDVEITKREQTEFNTIIKNEDPEVPIKDEDLEKNIMPSDLRNKLEQELSNVKEKKKQVFFEIVYTLSLQWYFRIVSIYFLTSLILTLPNSIVEKIIIHLLNMY